MRVKRGFMVLSGLLAAVAAWAYSVSGVITDETGEPLSDATVRLLSARDSAFIAGGWPTLTAVSP